MREYKSKVIKMYVDSDYEEFDNVETDFAENDEVVDLQDLPYAAERLSVIVDSVKRIKVRDTIERISLYSGSHTIKDLDALEMPFEIESLDLTIKLTTNREDTDELLNDLKKLANVRCKEYFIVFVPADDMTWQQQKDVLFYILPKVTVPRTSKSCGIYTGSNRLSLLTTKEKDDDDKKLEELLERVNDKSRTIGSDVLFEV